MTTLQTSLANPRQKDSEKERERERYVQNGDPTSSPLLNKHKQMDPECRQEKTRGTQGYLSSAFARGAGGVWEGKLQETTTVCCWERGELRRSYGELQHVGGRRYCDTAAAYLSILGDCCGRSPRRSAAEATAEWMDEWRWVRAPREGCENCGARVPKDSSWRVFFYMVLRQSDHGDRIPAAGGRRLPRSGNVRADIPPDSTALRSHSRHSSNAFTEIGSVCDFVGGGRV